MEPLCPDRLAVQPVFDVYKIGIIIKAENTKSYHFKDITSCEKVIGSPLAQTAVQVVLSYA